VSVPDALFEPLRGKGRTVRQALTEVARRWEMGARAADALQPLEDAVRHLLRRGQIRGELPPVADTGALARSFVCGLVDGRGAAAVSLVLEVREGRSARARRGG